ncbi:MAG: Uma2 family endonuclease [Imperialibacter sp.]|uniref:Uma2 family endonuclease n=1 Tax=Imperialibacter sp. TaxID=2038411 RepID=UPI0032F01E94
MGTVKIDKTKDWTVDDYLLLGETNTPCQLINGELIMSPSPTPLHQIVLSNLNDVIKAYGKKVDGLVLFSPLDLYIDNRNVFQPDLIFLSKRQIAYVTERGIEGPPELLVEVISPSNSYTDRYEKKNAYQKFGVLEYWILDPANRTLEIYYSADWVKPTLYLAGEGTVTSSVLKELNFNLKDLF